jgi:hypothetical protein
MFPPFVKLPFIVAPIRPPFNALSTLLVVDPVALMNGSIVMGVDPETVGLVSLPLPFIGIAVWIDEFSFAIDLVLIPLALEDAAIGKALNPSSVTFSVDPLSLVAASGGECHGG